MINPNFNNDIPAIAILDTEYKKYLQQSRQIIERLRTELLTRCIVPTQKNNTLEFNYWGFNILIKPEIRISDTKSFGLGELKAYITNPSTETADQILSYTFDISGNINTKYDINDFSKFYYHEMVVNLIEYSVRMNKMFQLL